MYSNSLYHSISSQFHVINYSLVLRYYVTYNPGIGSVDDIVSLEESHKNCQFDLHLILLTLVYVQV